MECSFFYNSLNKRDFDSPAEFFAGATKTCILNTVLTGKKQASAPAHLQFFLFGAVETRFCYFNLNMLLLIISAIKNQQSTAGFLYL
jgi:hypothetical protein